MEIHNRFKDLGWYAKSKGLEVGVVGVGGIGSWLTFLLARIGCNPFVFDDDILERHNQGGQLYGTSHMGKKKVVALAEIIKDFSETRLTIEDSRYTSESITGNIMFSAVDNMEARSIIFERWCTLVAFNKEHSPEDYKEMLFMDGRMLAENLQIFAVTPDKIDEYRKFIFPDSDIGEQPCSAKATSHCGSLIASLMVSIFTNWLTNLKVNIREVPFSTSFNIPLFELEPIQEFDNE